MKATGPFYIANRILRGTGILLAVGTAWWVWQNREVASPFLNLYEAWRLGKPAPMRMQTWTVHATKTFDGESFQARTTNGALYTVRLAGVDAPDPSSPSQSVRKQARLSRDFLDRRLGTNQLRVDVTLTNGSRIALGIVYNGKTNLNALCIATGNANFNRDFMVGTSFRSRYTLLQAERRAGRLRQP
ncbi:MAG: nuclease ue [Verrucomicrobiota bacterium]|jgi:endonuclease YncB( thermonuclease family)